MRQKNILIFLILLCFSSGLTAQESNLVSVLNKKLENYFATYPKENVFITTDKDIYSPGETIWFHAQMNKETTPNGNIKSKELTVEIYNSKGKIVADDKYHLTEGMANGDFELTEEMKEGTYYLVAYTDIHKQIDDVFSLTFQVNSYFPDNRLVQLVPVQKIVKGGEEARFYVIINNMNGSPSSKESFSYALITGNSIIEKGKGKTDENGKAIIQVDIPAQSDGTPLIFELTDRQNRWTEKQIVPSTLDKVKITFYPEGGNILPGVPVKIGFTAQNIWGNPLDIEGEIIDEEENIISQVKSFLSGYGLFPLVAKQESQYFLRLTGEIGKGQKFPLPKADPDKTGLAISKIDDEYVYTNIFIPDNSERNFLLTIANFNGINWAGDISISESTRLKIPVAEIPQGIHLVSLIDDKQNPVANRIIYINHNQQLNIQVELSDSTLFPQEKSELKIILSDENGNPVAGNITLSISDQFRLLDDQESMREHLQINSLLKNTIDNVQDLRSRAFDYMLIANKIKDFNWTDIMQSDTAKNETRNNLTISGQVVDKNGAGVPFAKISLIDKRSIHFFSEAADEQGYFSISGLDPSKKDNYIATATGANGEKEFKVIYSKSFKEQLSDLIATKHQIWTKNASIKDVTDYFSDNPFLFSKAPEKTHKTISGRNENIKRYLENGMAILDVIKMIKPYNMTGNKIVFYGSQNSFYAQDGALIVVDGQQLGTDATVLSSLSPTDIDRIHVSTNAMDIQRYSGLNSVGLIEIFTKKGNATSPGKPSPKLSENLYNGEFRIPRSFSIPEENSEDDFRTTLLWVPMVEINANGTVEISFPTSLVRSKFRIQAEGISNEGQVGKGTANIKIANY